MAHFSRDRSASLHSNPKIPSHLLIVVMTNARRTGRMSDGSHWARSVDGRDFASAHTSTRHARVPGIAGIVRFVRIVVAAGVSWKRRRADAHPRGAGAN